VTDPQVPEAPLPPAAELGPAAPLAPAAAVETEAVPEGRPESPFRRRLRKFRRLKRGYWAFLLITGAYVLSFFLPVLMNNVAFVVKYEGT
jgi:hypothetical protein